MKKNNLFVGLTIDYFNGIKPSTLLKVVKKLGLEFVELTSSVFDDLSSCVENVGNMKTGFHLPNFYDKGYDFSCRNLDSKIQQVIKLINENYIQLHINYCLSHPPENDSDLTREESISYLLNNLKKLEPPIIIENVQAWDEESFINFYDRAKSVLGEKLIGQCFDAPHYLLSGNDPIKYITNPHTKIRCIHLSDCKKDIDAHLAFGLGGGLPIDEILKTIRKVDYSGFINLELLPRNLKDISFIIKSYLKVIKVFNKRKYFTSLIKLFFYKSALEKTLKKAF